MVVHISPHDRAFSQGFTAITRMGEAEDDTGISLGIVRIEQGTVREFSADRETAVVLLNGLVRMELSAQVLRAQRRSLFDDPPVAALAPSGAVIRATCETDAEPALIDTANRASFPPILFRSDDVRP